MQRRQFVIRMMPSNENRKKYGLQHGYCLHTAHLSGGIQVAVSFSLRGLAAGSSGSSWPHRGTLQPVLCNCKLSRSSLFPFFFFFFSGAFFSLFFLKQTLGNCRKLWQMLSFFLKRRGFGECCQTRPGQSKTDRQTNNYPSGQSINSHFQCTPRLDPNQSTS